MLAFALLGIGVLSRVILHVPNFTPVVALALFGGMRLGKRTSLWMPLALMVVSDVFIGFHNIIAFTWGSILLISLIGRVTRKKHSIGATAGLTLASAVLFFIVTNFGAWLVMYPRTFAGIVECYTLAIPFFRYTLVSTIVYSAALFGVYELAAYRLAKTRLAWVVS